MKIIKEGKAIGETPVQLTCRSCGCVVEVLRKELKHSPDQRDPFQYVDCPTKGCGQIIQL